MAQPTCIYTNGNGNNTSGTLDMVVPKVAFPYGEDMLRWFYKGLSDL